MCFQLLKARCRLLPNSLQQLLRALGLLIEHRNPPVHVLVQRRKAREHGRLLQLRHQLQQRVRSLSLIKTNPSKFSLYKIIIIIIINKRRSLFYCYHSSSANFHLE